MIAHVVVDLPLEGPFDYLVPREFESSISAGVRVKVPFGPRTAIGYVISLAAETTIPRIKPIKAVVDSQPIFDARDMEFARRFCGYYGCFLGEALSLMTRHRRSLPLLEASKESSSVKLYHCIDGKYADVLREVMAASRDHFVIVPDAFAARSLPKDIPVGLRSSIFEAFSRTRTIIIVDEDNSSFKQEQSPKYEARQAALMARAVYGFDLVFISQTPSVELMHLVRTGQIQYERRGGLLPKPSVIDLTNYKFLDKGILSVPVRNMLESNIKNKQRSLVLFNRKGTFGVTRCSQCGYILKCRRCDSAMSFARASQSFVCRQCQEELKDAGDCPTCGVPSWKSFGMGIEKVQKEIASLFPIARIAVFERADEGLPDHWDVLVATSAVLRFKDSLRVACAAVIDVDSALNRLDIRSSFNVWSMLHHLMPMARGMQVQTRNPDHPMVRAYSLQDDQKFYSEELSVRQELKLPPFVHWVSVVFRSRKEKSAQEAAQDVYNQIKSSSTSLNVMDVVPDVPAKLRDQYRFRLMIGGSSVEDAVAAVKQAVHRAKRASGVIITLDIDP